MAQRNNYQPKRIVLWGGWYGSYNVGDQVLLLSITDMLAEMLGAVEFIVISARPEIVLEYTQRQSQQKFCVLQNKRQFNRIALDLATSDLFVFGGGVPFYEQPSHVLAMLVLVGLARLFKTPYMTWTVSSQVVKSQLAKRAFKWVLEGAQEITYRDEHTRQLFLSCGVKHPMSLTADPAFHLKLESQEQAVEIIRRAGHPETNRPFAALTPRVLYGREGGAQAHYQARTAVQYQREIDCFAAALDWLWENGFQPLFVSMNTHPPDDDRLAAQQIISASKHGSKALLVDQQIPPRLAPAVYNHCQVSFVARVHGSITSMLGHCPVMMYAFDPKHRGIMDAMELSAYSLREEAATPARTIEMLSDLLNHRLQVQKAMIERLATLRQQALIPARLAARILGAD